MSSTREKILVLLLAGLTLGFTYAPHKQWRIIKEVTKEWRRINEKALKEEIRKLYRSKLIERKENPDGSFTFVLADKGKLRALTFHFRDMKIKKGDWDGKWRIVIFDIPEKLKRARDALRDKLKEIGFYEFQKSVFVFPYECRDEMNFIVEFFELQRYVRIGLLETVDNELHLKKIFNLI